MVRNLNSGRLLAFSIVLIFFAFIAWMVEAGYRGSSQAEALCASIHAGEDVATVRATMKASTGRFMSLNSDPNYLAVSFHGAGAEKYECTVDLADGKVVKIKTNRVD